MTRLCAVSALLLGVASLLACTRGFAPSTTSSPRLSTTSRSGRTFSPGTRVHMGFGLGDEEPKKLTRDNEPEDYFATNLDKLSDKEKLPIALGGLAFISLPFIIGLIALYASK